MRRKFKSFEDAKRYFSDFDVKNLKTPHQHEIINSVASAALESDEVCKEDKKFWSKLKQDALEQIRSLGWFVFSEENLEDAINFLGENLRVDQLMELIFQLVSLEELTDEEIDNLYALCRNVPEAENFFDVLCDERCQRNPNLN